MNKRLLITLSTAIFLLVATIIAIQLAKGYRPDFSNGQIKATGLLLANSVPRGAQVFVNGKLRTATDDTLNLSPGEYEIEIKKEGYLSWKKKIKIEAELVSEANARLFPAVPELKPLTFTGAKQPVLSPDASKIYFNNKDGFWVLDLSTRPLTTPKPRKTTKIDFYQEIEKEREIEEKTKMSQFSRFPLEFQQTAASESAEIISFSPDETKLLYKALENVKIPEGLTPKVLGASTQTEEREVRANVLYVYDRKEDKNFRIHEAIENIFWFPDSRHLVFVEEQKIKIVEYDGKNEIVVYAGVFEENFAAVWPDGSRLITLANLNPTSPLPPNLYAINLK